MSGSILCQMQQIKCLHSSGNSHGAGFAAANHKAAFRTFFVIGGVLQLIALAILVRHLFIIYLP
jgi:hypothetical protein